MNPFSRSEWIFPAAVGAVLPSRTFQARTSSSPTVRKEIYRVASKAPRTSWSRADRAIPISFRKSACSAGDSWAISSSTFAHRRTRGTFAFSASFVTSGYVSFAASPSPTFRIRSVGRRLTNRNPERTRSSSIDSSTLRRGISRSNAAIALCRAVHSASRFASFVIRSIRFCATR